MLRSTPRFDTPTFPARIEAGMPLVAGRWRTAATSLSMIQKNYAKVLARTRREVIQKTSPNAAAGQMTTAKKPVDRYLDGTPMRRPSITGAAMPRCRCGPWTITGEREAVAGAPLVWTLGRRRQAHRAMARG
jgi:hypothetical protein